MPNVAATTAVVTSHDKGKRMRVKKRCPVANCSAKVISLPRHLRLRHAWSRHRAVAAVGNFALCKLYTYRVRKNKPTTM